MVKKLILFPLAISLLSFTFGNEVRITDPLPLIQSFKDNTVGEASIISSFYEKIDGKVFYVVQFQLPYPSLSSCGPMCYRSFDKHPMNVDVNSFEMLFANGDVAYDNKKIYIKGRTKEESEQKFPLYDADIKTLKKLQETDDLDYGYGYLVYLKDKNSVFMGYEKIKNADPDTFKKLDYNGNWSKDKNNVYYNGDIIKNADTSSFKAIDADYGTDIHSAYYKGEKILDSDVNSFETFTHDDYSKDKNDIYFKGKKIISADVSSFVLISNSDYSKDKNNVYYLGEKVIGADADTFTASKDAYRSEDSYAKDKNSSYYKGKKTNEIFKDLGDNYFQKNNAVYYNNIILEGSDPDTFEVLKDGYAKDKNFVYRQIVKINNANPDTFRLITCFNSNCYYKDKNFVYYNGEKIENADPGTFEILDTEYFAKDKNSAYLGRRIIDKDVDSKTFKVLGCNFTADCYSGDAKNVYYGPTKINGADPASFKILTKNNTREIYYYAKDKKNLYNFGEIEKIDADIDTIEIIDRFYKKDKNYVYYENKKMEQSDSKTFVVLNRGFSKDKNNVYYYGKKLLINSKNAVFSDRDYVRDEKYIYYGSQMLENVDIASFVLLEEKYSRDKNNIYYAGRKLNNPDLATFEVIKKDESGNNGEYAKDKNSVYYNEKRLSGSDPKTFKIISDNWEDYSLDKNNVYYGSEIVIGADPKSFKKIDNIWVDKSNTYERGKKVELK